METINGEDVWDSMSHALHNIILFYFPVNNILSYFSDNFHPQPIV